MNLRTRPLSTLRAPTLSVGATLALCTAVLLWLYWPVNDWRTLPLTYQGDGLWSLFVIKTVLQTGWYASNPQLGAPFGANFLDFAKPEVLHLAFIRFAGVFTQDIALVHNLFYALGFHLVALSALAVLRRGFDLSWPLAVAGALLFSFLPFHFFRLEHLFLSSYYVVPIAAWLVLKVASEHPPFFEAGHPGTGRWTVWVACAVLASTSIYYAFFGLCLILATGALEALRRRVWQPLGSATLICALLSGLVMANLAPSLLHRYAQGRNPEVAVRPMQEVDVYALRPLQMMLPSFQHRSPTLSTWTRKYEAGTPFVNENRSAALGLLGSAGLLLMLLALLAGHRIMQSLPAFGTAARTSAVALLLSIAGGGGSLIALALSPQFRALNRISVVIAFFAIAALLLLQQRAAQSAPSRFRRSGLAVLAALLLVIGLWDQIPSSVRPPSRWIAARYNSDRAFVQRIEHQLPVGSRVLQLPYIAFPEAPPLHREGTYSHLRGFLHGERLRWSYGGMNGRTADLWHRALAEKALPERVRIAAASGFNGIWLDRRAMPDGGARMEAELQAIGLDRGFLSADKSLAFYPLHATGTEAVSLQLPPLLAQGFYPWEHNSHGRWAWTHGDAQLVFSLPHPGPRRLRVTLGLRTLVPRTVSAIVQGHTVASIRLLPGRPQPLVFEHTASSAQITVQLRTDVPARPPGGGDRRPLAMSLASFDITEVE